MKLEAMRLFAEVVKQGNYSRAAEHLRVSKGYLSQQVKSLEKALNKQLLVRNTRNMRLTPAGELLYERARLLTTFYQDTSALLNEHDDGLAGSVKCTAPSGLAKYMLFPKLQPLLQEYREISLMIDSGNYNHNLIAEDFDFAVRMTNTPPEDVVARKLGTVHYVCVATPKYIEQYGQPSHPSELHKYPCSALAHWKNWRFQEATGERISIDVVSFFESSDNELLLQACFNHMALIRVPDYMVSKSIKNGELVQVLTEYAGEQKDIYLLYPQLSSRPKRVKLCLDHLQS